MVKMKNKNLFYIFFVLFFTPELLDLPLMGKKPLHGYSEKKNAPNE